MLADQQAGGIRTVHATKPPHESPDRASHLHRTSRGVAFPERHLARLSRSGRNDHTLRRNVVDTPGSCAKQKPVADPAFKNHFFVKLANAGRTGIGAGGKDAKQSAVRYRASVRDRDLLCAFARAKPVRNPVPDEAWT